MATSAFKSTTKRAAISGSTSEDSSSATRSLRRSRSLSRFSRPTSEKKFVTTTRGSAAATQFPEISLDDLALEFFSSSSVNESDGGAAEVKHREGRSATRRGEIGRWASDTASSRRRERSVSKTRGDVVSSSEKSVVARGGEIGRWASDTASSRRRGRSVSKTRADVVSSKNGVPSDAGSRRRRSLSVAPYQISDSESEVDHSRLSNRANLKAPISGNSQMPLAQKAIASSNRRLGRTRSDKDLSMLRDGYSSHSSALTDDESKDTRIRNNGFEKIIRAVHAQKKPEHPIRDVANGGLYEAMRKELRYAVDEIRSELNQSMERSRTGLTSGDSLPSDNSEALQDFSRIRKNYSTKSEQFEKHKQNLLSEMLLEEQQEREITKMVKELPDSRTSTEAGTPLRARKRSSDRNRMSNRLFEEAERYFEDFLSNVEDTDISSFDGERSDGSSTLGGTVRSRDAIRREAETYKSPAGSTSRPVEMEGVILPWLQWETSTQTPITPKALHWDSEKDPSNYSSSTHGSSWTPGLFSSPPTAKTEKALGNDRLPSYDLDEYLKLGKNEELMFEMYRERNRVNYGGLLLCTSVLY